MLAELKFPATVTELSTLFKSPSGYMPLVLYDDTSSSIAYLGKWGRGGSESEFGGTTHGTTSAHSVAIIRFKGSSVTIFGTVAAESKSSGPVTTYNLDDEDAVTFTAHPSANDAYNVTFFTSTQLPLEDHTLVISTQTEGSQYWLDYYSFDTDDISTSSTSTSESSNILSTQPTPPATSVSSTTSQTTSSTAAASVSQSSTVSEGKVVLSTGSIVGIAVGASTFIVAILVLLWFFQKFRRSTMATSDAHASDRVSTPHMGGVEPFLPSSTSAINNLNSHNDWDSGAFRKSGRYTQAIVMPVTPTRSMTGNMSGGPSEAAGTSNTENSAGDRASQLVGVTFEPYPAESPPDYHHRHANPV